MKRPGQMQEEPGGIIFGTLPKLRHAEFWGRASYLAQDRPELQIPAKAHARHMSAPTRVTQGA
eukprot:465717-Pyramimonas_sp.AAC.1